MDQNELNGYLQIAQVLIALGLATYTQIREFFTKQIADDATLTMLMTQLDARIARRSDPPPAP